MKKYLLFILLITAGCEDTVRVSEECSVHENPDFVNSHFDFQVGTVWVYELENSDERDTVTVYYHSPSLPPALNDFIWFAKSSQRQYNYFQCYYNHIHRETNYTLEGCYRNVVNSGYEKNGHTSNYASFLVSDKIGEKAEVDIGYLENHFNEIEINSINYQDVYVFLRPVDFGFNEDSVRYFIADHYGIVRWENLVNGDIWELVESNIVK